MNEELPNSILTRVARRSNIMDTLNAAVLNILEMATFKTGDNSFDGHVLLKIFDEKVVLNNEQKSSIDE